MNTPQPDPRETQAETPETDAVEEDIDYFIASPGDFKVVRSNFCRQMERQRDEARRELEELKQALTGRTVSCAACNEVARERDEARKALAEAEARAAEFERLNFGHVDTLADYSNRIRQLTAEREHNANMAGMYKACASRFYSATRDRKYNDPSSLTEMDKLALAEYARCLEADPKAGGLSPFEPIPEWMFGQSVEARNALQNSGRVHPYTCGGNRGDEAHKAYQAKHGGDFGQLLAVEGGWVCPVCLYTQKLTLPPAPATPPEK